MDETIHQLTTKFLKTLSANLGKTTSKANLGGGNEVLADPSLQIIIHMISCTRSLRDAFELSTGGAANNAQNNGSNSVKKPKNPIYSQLYQPMLNGMLALLGKMLMDSFSFEPKVSDTAAFAAAYGILGRHILTLFPEMASKKHKVSGKMLIHHAVFKARPEVAEETVGHILKVSPSSARAEDATGALPLHWATRNPEISFELIDLLLKSYPEAPTKADSKGFLPLHWAVNQDTPNVEVVRKLIKIFPTAAGMPTQSGNLPLHYCVSRARPSIPVIKALIAAYPGAIRSGCEDGYLPLHRYLYRPLVDLDALRLLINYYPDALLAKSNRNQTPLHVAVDHHSPDALAVDLLLQVCPSAISIVDSDRYLPLHLCLDCAEPNYALALQLLVQYPQAANCATKDDMLPLHLLVGANTDPTHEHSQHGGEGPGSPGSGNSSNDAVAFVTALLQAYPQALVTTVRDIIPAMDGVALADPESWSGEWVESYWSPLTRARDRGLTGLVQVFSAFQQQHGIRDGSSGAGNSSSSSQAAPSIQAPAAPAPSTATFTRPLSLPASSVPSQQGAHNNSNDAGIVVHRGDRSPQHEIIPFHQEFRPQNANPVPSNVNTSNEYMSNAAVPVKSQPLNNNNNNNNYSGVNPIRFTSPGSYYDAGNEDSTNDEAGGVTVTNRTARLSKPQTRVPPHILKAQASAAASARASSAGSVTSNGSGRDSRASSREHERQRAQQQAFLQHQYQQQQQLRGRGGNQSDNSDYDIPGNIGGGSGQYNPNQLQEMSLAMESVYSTHSMHSAPVGMQSVHSAHSGSGGGSVGPERSRDTRDTGNARDRDTTPLRQQQNYALSNPNNNPNLNNNPAGNGGNGSKAPPPGPIPASLLQAAENNAMRHAKAQQQHIQHGSSSGDLSGKSSSKRSKPVPSVVVQDTSPQRMPRTRSNNSNNNQMESPPPQQSNQQQLASTTGLGRPNPGRYEGSDDNNVDMDAAKYRVATAPTQQSDRNRTQPRMVGIGKTTAWSNGEETEFSVDAPHSDSNVQSSSAASNSVNAKQQRLLQAQQQYMKRAAGNSSSISGNITNNINVVRSKPGAPAEVDTPNSVGLGPDSSSGGPALTLKPTPISTGAAAANYHRTVATNHTSEMMKTMGGKVRIHPVSKTSHNNNNNLNPGLHGNNSNVDEMV